MTSKAIIINGFARGGTNILWNIMQSHPNIVSPIFETSEIISKKHIRNPLVRFLTFHQRFSKYHLSAKHISRLFCNFKLQNLTHPDNQYKAEGVPYSMDEIKAATMCIKGVYAPGVYDIKYSDLFDRIYNPTYHIIIVREGLSLCEGWKRRGIDPKMTANMYNEFMQTVLHELDKRRNIGIIDFNKLIEQPFEHAEKLFRFCSEEPFHLDQIRLKVKKTLGTDNSHKARYGQENRKYWFDRDTIGDILVPDISNTQKQGITEAEREGFLKNASDGISIFQGLKTIL
jgi:hypothetical protein